MKDHDSESGVAPGDYVESASSQTEKAQTGLSRRGLLQGLGGVAGVGMLGTVPALVTPGKAEASVEAPGKATARESEALQRRTDAAIFQLQKPVPALASNDDETLYASRIGSFTKTLPHNDLGEVDGAAYDALLQAFSSGLVADFDNVPAGGGNRLANPRAANAFALAGADSRKVDMPAVHAFASPRQSAEAGEVYWMAYTRDVRFSEYDTHPRTNAAAADMSNFSDFTGPREGGSITTSTLFRGLTPGDLAGPYISQFLFLDIPYGNTTIHQTARHPVLRDDYMADYDSWLAVQRGQFAGGGNNLRQVQRYITRGRDLGEYVHKDHPYQAYLNAGLICLNLPGALDESPYSAAMREGGFVTFGVAGLLDLVATAAVTSLRVAWFHKWLIHRKLRPEAFGGRIHNHMTGAANYPINHEILNSPVLDNIFSQQGNYLLPQAFPEGSPTHPSYPAGHATIAGACVTVLKAFFNEDYEIPSPVEPNAAGTQLLDWTGEGLTLGGELNKLASNIALGRNIAGVHWRADGDDGLVAGEEVAITLLQDWLRMVTEEDPSFVLTRFDGTEIRITEDSADPV